MKNLTIKQLKALAAEKGIVPTGDKRLKATWLNALTPFPTPASEPTGTTTHAVTPWLTNNIRTRQIALLERNSLAQLKTLAKERGITPAGDPRKKSTWANAIYSHGFAIA